MSKFGEFLKKKDIEISFKRYAVDALSAMAQGLFCSLLVGTIISTAGQLLNVEFLRKAGSFASSVSGPAMAVAIGFALKCPPMVLFSLTVCGYAANVLGGAGGPLAVFIVSVIAAESGKAVSKETKVDILVTPLVTVLVGTALACLTAPFIGRGASYVGFVIMKATELRPFLMGVVVALLVGAALTLPISSAAICASLSLTGLAGGAALAGCCAQMVGFAVASFKDNKWGGLVSQGLGTSMLQMGNIVKKPFIWVAPLVASAVNGPVATCIFKLQMNGPAVSSGMGTCGLVGQIGTFTGWMSELESGARTAVTAMDWIGLAVVSFIVPAVVCCVLTAVFRKAGLIKDKDMAL